MRYCIHHSTRYSYGETVPLCQNALWLTPRDCQGQKRESLEITITPEPSSRSTRQDYFGNDVTFFSIEQGFRELEIHAVSVVNIEPHPAEYLFPQTAPWEQVALQLGRDLSTVGIDATQYCFDSPAAAATHPLEEYARESFLPERPLAEAAYDLMTRIHRDFKYEPGVTTVNTNVDEVFRLRRGVCQDFAHLQIACLRSLGLAARYISGYVRTLPQEGQARLVGADASHAWVSVFAGGGRWIDYDPTNAIVPHQEHVTVAWGRDYQDVPPVKGLFVGGGMHDMTVSVDVDPLE